MYDFCIYYMFVRVCISCNVRKCPCLMEKVTFSSLWVEVMSGTGQFRANVVVYLSQIAGLLSS